MEEGEVEREGGRQVKILTEKDIADDIGKEKCKRRGGVSDEGRRQKKDNH